MAAPKKNSAKWGVLFPFLKIPVFGIFLSSEGKKSRIITVGFLIQKHKPI